MIPDVSTEVRLFRKICLSLHALEEAKHRTRELDRLGGLYQRLAPVYSKINDRALEALLPSEDRLRAHLGEHNQYLYLQPLMEGDPAIPVVDLLCDFGQSQPRMRIQIQLFHENEDGLHGIGFRFESPEGASGVHSYFHVQMFKSFKSREKALRGRGVKLPQWLPETQPAITLDAFSSTSLILCAVVSLYGPDYLRELNRQLNSIGGVPMAPFESEKKRMHFAQLGDRRASGTMGVEG